MKRRFRLVILVCFLLSACTAMQPIHVKLNYKPEKPLKKSMPVKGEADKLHITRMDILDKRVDRKYLGSTDALITGTGVIEWVRSGIMSLSEHGYSFHPMNEEGSSSGLALKVNIKRVSCRGTLMQMRSTVLIEVGFFSDGVLIQRKLYYGTQLESKGIISQGSRHFGEKAVLQGLNSALEQFLVKLEADLRQIREGQKNNSYNESMIKPLLQRKEGTTHFLS